MSSFARALAGKTTDATGVRKVVDYLTGTRRVNNAGDPNSAYSKSLGGIGKPNPQNPAVKKQFTKTGQTFGVGVK